MWASEGCGSWAPRVFTPREEAKLESPYNVGAGGVGWGGEASSTRLPCFALPSVVPWVICTNVRQPLTWQRTRGRPCEAAESSHASPGGHTVSLLWDKRAHGNAGSRSSGPVTHFSHSQAVLQSGPCCFTSPEATRGVRFYCILVSSFAGVTIFHFSCYDRCSVKAHVILICILICIPNLRMSNISSCACFFPPFVCPLWSVMPFVHFLI